MNQVIASNILILFLNYLPFLVSANDVLGCGGFIKSHVPIDFSKVEVKLITKQGTVKDRTSCAPNNGYYFVPLYDKGELILALSPPPGWSFTPKEVHLNIDGADSCSQGEDINFVFEGFGIAGKVESLGSSTGQGPQGILVELLSKDSVRSTETDVEGAFSFSPVFPGTFTVKISHPRWKVYKDSVTVQVTEGNTNLPDKSLIVQGYDVTGQILTADGDPVKNTIIVLSSKTGEKGIIVDGCNKKEIINSNVPKNSFLCYITSNSLGQFVFPVVPVGSYLVTPYYEDQNIYYQPEKIEFSVLHTSLQLDDHFQVIGFSIPGKVTKGNKEVIPNAKIYLNGHQVAITDSLGKYKLEKLKVGKYQLKAEADNLIFEEINIHIDTTLQSLPNLVPSAYKVCGKVVSSKAQVVTFSQIGSTKFSQTETNSKQQFCQFLTTGKYEVQVSVHEEDRRNGLQFFPIKQQIEVSSEPLPDLIFSQLKASITGKVNCIQKDDCEGLDIIFRSGLDEITVPVLDSFYSARDMHPGSYEISLSKNKLCWKTGKQNVNINTAKAEIPTFVQTGYLVNFVSSHEAKITYKTLNQGKPIELHVQRGVTSTCLEAPGKYIFSINSCHEFETDSVTYNTSPHDNQITINAVKHTVAVSIHSTENYGPLEVTIQIGNDKTKQMLSFVQNKYEMQLKLKPSEVATLTPKSDLLFFTPSTLQIEGSTDCVQLGNKFNAVRGRVFKGRTDPPLTGVLVTVVDTTNNEVYVTETDINGLYKFPPLNSNSKYEITAEKDSYVFTGPDDSGKLNAQKLAEISVQVVDNDSNATLAGVLLSLSGGESFRKNLQTDSSGKITFYSLNAADYFLRPMMKEYLFEPSSKMIRVEEGATVNVNLAGKRVAFSAFGKLTSVNDDPVENVNIIAAGIDNCTGYSEEATTDHTGLFRIRGLQPYCSFRVTVQVGSDSSDLAERTSPEFIEIKNINQDAENLHITVFRPVMTTDVLLKIYAENVDHYRFLKVTLYRETDNPALIYTSYLDSLNIKIERNRNHGILIHLPSLKLDNKEYSVHLESSHGVKGSPQMEYFNANISFKLVEMHFSVKSNTKEQPIKQTSMWAVVYIFVILLLVTKVQIIADLLKKYLNFNVNSLSSYIPVSSGSKSVNDYDNDIDQIVQDINNVRRNRSKKVN